MHQPYDEAAVLFRGGSARMIDLVPLSQFSERYKAGWRMRPGYELKAGDYAVLMQSPDHEDIPLSNKSLARTYSNYERAGHSSRARKIKAVGT